MVRKRAILVHTVKRVPLDVKWRPMLADDEMEYANARLQQCRMPYRWRWLGNMTTLAGSCNLQEQSDNAAVSLGSSCHSG